MKRWVATLVLATTGFVGCDFNASDLANFLSSPFGDGTARVFALDEKGIEAVMQSAVGRFRAYNRLREVLPFAVIAGGPCGVNSRVGGEAVITTDMACAFDSEASGTVRVTQAQLATMPVVFQFSVVYEAVLTPNLAVTGTELLTETVDVDGATVHDLAVVQDGVTLKYTFRTGTLGDGAPVFDYIVSTAGGDAAVRITNPTGPGAFATVIVTGSDGSLRCDLRDTDWSLAPRGSCDNGVVFGLP